MMLVVGVPPYVPPDVVAVWRQPTVVASLVQAIGTVLGALIVGVAGTGLTRWFARRRDQQDRESQWRSHAVELTKLEMQRKLETWKDGQPRPRPAILDFLATYRDLQELGTRSPKELYETIKRDRIPKDTLAVPTPSDPPAPLMTTALTMTGLIVVAMLAVRRPRV